MRCRWPSSVYRLSDTVVPNLWGLWNIIWVALLARGTSRSHVRRAAAVPARPGGLLLAHLFRFDIPHLVPYLSRSGVIIYYLVWKHVVGGHAIIGIA